MLEASQFDSYAYLFSKPTFISLDPAASVDGIDVAGIRIGVNGAEAKVGQTYIPLSAAVGGANYVSGTGQLLSSTGAVIGLEKGPVADEFFLTFERIGTRTNIVSVPNPTEPAVIRPATHSAPEYGVRTFDELNQSFSNITGVPTNAQGVAATYATVKQQMPTVESISAFLASHQTGIAQLAISYCSAMVNDTTLRTAFFGAGLDPAAAGSFFNVQGNRDIVINALKTKAVGTSLSTQPLDSELETELNALLQKIGATRDAGTAAKAACAAVLGSAAVVVQ
jgi:hypothetical protein